MAQQQSGKVLVVGAGVTGAALSHLLQDARVALKHVPEVVVWEKNNITGGRMMARCACFVCVRRVVQSSSLTSSCIVLYLLAHTGRSARTARCMWTLVRST